MQRSYRSSKICPTTLCLLQIPTQNVFYLKIILTLKYVCLTSSMGGVAMTKGNDHSQNVTVRLKAEMQTHNHE